VLNQSVQLRRKKCKARMTDSEKRSLTGSDHKLDSKDSWQLKQKQNTDTNNTLHSGKGENQKSVQVPIERDDQRPKDTWKPTQRSSHGRSRSKSLSAVAFMEEREISQSEKNRDGTSHRRKSRKSFKHHAGSTTKTPPEAVLERGEEEQMWTDLDWGHDDEKEEFHFSQQDRGDEFNKPPSVQSGTLQSGSQSDSEHSVAIGAPSSGPAMTHEPKGSDPLDCYCPACHKQVQTIVLIHRKTKAYVVFVILLVLFIWPFCLIPLLMKRCETPVHYCSNCKTRLTQKSPGLMARNLKDRKYSEWK